MQPTLSCNARHSAAACGVTGFVAEAPAGPALVVGTVELGAGAEAHTHDVRAPFASQNCVPLGVPSSQ